jgi:hypothetical protein
MRDPTDTLLPLVKKLELWRPLDKREKEAVLALPHKVEEVLRTNTSCEREISLLTLPSAGWLRLSAQVLVDGSRSINAIHMKGDAVDLQIRCSARPTQRADADPGHGRLHTSRRDYARRFRIPQHRHGDVVRHAVDGSIFREWIANIARARRRVAWPIFLRIRATPGSDRPCDRLSYELPMTQEQWRMQTGLTPVHINRTHMDLGERGLIARTKVVAIADWKRWRTWGVQR